MPATIISTLPSEHSSQLIQNMVGSSFVMSYANIQIGSTRGNTFVIDNDDTLGQFQVTRDDEKDETGEATSLKTIPSTTIYKRIVIPNQSRQDDTVLYNAIIERTAAKLAVTVDAAVAGLIATMPTGFDKIDASASIEVSNTDTLIDAQKALAEVGYAPTAFWLSPAGKAEFLKMTDTTGQPIFGNYSTGGLGSILGLPAFTNRWSGAVLGYFGDWSKLIVPISNAIRVRANPYSDRAFHHNSTEYLVEIDLGCGLTDTTAISKLVAPAA